jgi:hypothetical protein
MQEDIRRALADLRRQLETSAPLDAELRSQLADLDRDIHRALAQPPLAGEPAAASAAPDDDPLVGRARDASARLASEHPLLEATLRELADKLGKMGI